MFSISTTSAKQSVGDTISVLSGRLSSAILVEDRRLAIQGLRSFAKDFPASVASGALRSLIGSLAADKDDFDTIKVVLETLLLLFNPNDSSPEASDEIVLWLADELTQHQENTQNLLHLIESYDFFSRLYSLQLLAAIHSARDRRAEECVLNAPLGICHLVALLDDTRDAIRDQAISVLIDYTQRSTDIQKLVAFQNAFDRILTIVKVEGSLFGGGRVVEDCLVLLANLLRQNAPNQSLFRESGCITRLATILGEALKAGFSNANAAEWAQIQRTRNIHAFLTVIKLCLQSHASAIHQNQMAFWKHGLVHLITQLAFSCETGLMHIRAEAFFTCGDMIRNSHTLQESFSQITIPLSLQVPDMVLPSPDRNCQIFVIDGLLDLILNSPSKLFDLRFAACECLKSYFSNHGEVKMHFLSRAIEGYQQGMRESANILDVLLRPSSETTIKDPYRQWFAAVITFHLLYENPPAKAKALSLSEGDSGDDEELVSGLQATAAYLLMGISRGDDARTLAGYMMLLIGWMFDDPEAVNDFLAEGSTVQGLIEAILRPLPSLDEVVLSLATLLLGVVYEFSRKSSPVPRSTLQSILLSRLGRDRYIDNLQKLRVHPLVRDFEIATERLGSSDEVSHVLFDTDFINFFKDNYSRLVRAIDKDPLLDTANETYQFHQDASKEVAESLRLEMEAKSQALEDAMAKIAQMEEQLNPNLTEDQLSSDTNVVELAKPRDTDHSMPKSHATGICFNEQQLASQTSPDGLVLTIAAELASKQTEHHASLAKTQNAVRADLNRARQCADKETMELRKIIFNLEESLTRQITEIEEANKQIYRFKSQLNSATEKIKNLEKRAENAESELQGAIQMQRTTQAELDDLLILMSDLDNNESK